MTSKVNVTFLGTSDQIPSAKRNHPAMLLNYDGENILFDCGEGTQRQFRKARLNPCKITRIVLTHLHGDHVLGLPGLLSTLALSGYNKILYIYGPKGTKIFINSLLRLFNFRREYKINIEEVEGKFFEGKDFYLKAESMEHGIACNAYLFVKVGQRRIDKVKLKKSKLKEGPVLQDLKNGKNVEVNGRKYLAKNLTYFEDDLKVGFVLDTKFNSRIVPFVKNSDLFICESTYMNDLLDQAKEHNHLTAKQCGEIAKKAKVGKLVLTHISQRYEFKKKEVLEEAKKIFKESYLVKDLDVLEI